MINLSQIQQDLTGAMKSKDQIAVDTLRGLKTRIQNAQTSGAGTKELSETEITALVRSEVKRRKEAAESFKSGDRSEMAEKELQEAAILEKYLPAQMPESQIADKIDQAIAAMAATAGDFGKVMGKLKGELGDSVDGAVLAKLLKEKLK